MGCRRVHLRCVRAPNVPKSDETRAKIAAGLRAHWADPANRQKRRLAAAERRHERRWAKVREQVGDLGDYFSAVRGEKP
jgi:hypothetical protein